MITDFRYALRTLLHSPAFSLVVVLTLGLGIGANTAIFSLIDQLLLRLLPVVRPEELVQLDGPGPFNGRTQNDRTFSYPMYQDLRDGNDVFTGAHRPRPGVGQPGRGRSGRARHRGDDLGQHVRGAGRAARARACPHSR